MGERVGASIQLGGKLPRSAVQDLIDLLDGLYVDFDEGGADETNLGSKFGSWEVNYGDLDDIKAFAQDHGLDYLYWCDSGSEWLAYSERWRPGGTSAVEFAEQNGEYYVSIRELERDGLEAVLADLGRLKAPLPPLEVVG